MNLRIRRRRFGQLALASAVTAAIANFASKAVAQPPPQIIGVRLGSSSTGSGGSLLSLKLPIGGGINVNTTPTINLISLDLGTGKEQSLTQVLGATVDNVGALVTNSSTNSAVSTEPSERLTALTSQPNGTLIVTTVANTNNGIVSRVVFADPKSSQPQRALNVTGFQNNRSTVESVLATKDDQILSIVSLNQGTPPFDLAMIDSKTGVVTSGKELGLQDLQTGAAFNNLTQSPDGKIIAITVGREGSPSLVQLDMDNKQLISLSQLRLDNKPLGNGLLGLAFSPTGELYGLANPKYEATNNLYMINLTTGEMTFVSKFDAAKITF